MLSLKESQLVAVERKTQPDDSTQQGHDLYMLISFLLNFQVGPKMYMHAHLHDKNFEDDEPALTKELRQEFY